MASDTPSVQFIVPDCPWCREPMDWLKERSDLNNAKVHCTSCGRPVKVNGKLTILIEAEKAPWLQAVGKEEE